MFHVEHSPSASDPAGGRGTADPARERRHRRAAASEGTGKNAERRRAGRRGAGGGGEQFPPQRPPQWSVFAGAERRGRPPGPSEVCRGRRGAPARRGRKFILSLQL